MDDDTDINIGPTASIAAPLADPFYYLENALTLVRWVVARHDDLLTAEEQLALEDFLALPRHACALLVRLVMRSRDTFRVDTLAYAELPANLDALIGLLAARGWLDTRPLVSIADLCQLYRKGELVASLAPLLETLGIGPGAAKATMVTALVTHFGDTRHSAAHWLDDSDRQLVALTRAALFERVRLMFFGNLRQDWSEFVITELGHQRYESVPFPVDSRAFQHREDVDTYLALHHHGQRLEDGEPAAALWPSAPRQALANPWLEHRRQRLLFRLGQGAERDGDLPLALDAYRSAWNEDARIRYFRLQERTAAANSYMADLKAAHDHSATETERLLLGRILARAGGAGGRRATPSPWPTEHLRLPRADAMTVEQHAAGFYCGDDSHCFYVENGLFNGLLGLLLWPAIFAPLPGAFFHPFQAGPADLFRADFATRRATLVADCLAALEDGSHRDRIRHHWHSRRGVSCPLVHWPLFTEELLELALHCIPAAHLAAIFRRLLGDLRRNRSGLPDLIRFWPRQGCYEVIEVKGPGDRLQDHQRLWLHFFVAEGIPARVCHLRWEDMP